MRHIVFAAFLMSMSTLHSYAQSSSDQATAELLVRQCELVGTESNPVWCFGFLTGIRFGIEATDARSGQPEICFPRSTSTDQLRKIFLKYMEDHPANLHYGPGYMAYLAFLGAFPCTK